MKKLINKLCSAFILAMLMRPGLEAAPQKTAAAVAATQHDASSSPSTADEEMEGKTLNIPPFVPPATHIDQLKGPGYEVHVHDYNGPIQPPVPQMYTDSIVEVLKMLADTFHFITIVDKDDILATDLVDESWYGWLDYMKQVMPIISQFKIHANDIEHPNDDAPMSLWDSILYLFLKRTNVNRVDETDVDGDGHKENNLNVQYTSIKFDPIGQLMQKLWSLVKEYSGYNSFSHWWKRVEHEMYKYSAFKHESITTEEIDEEKLEDGIHHPEGVISMSPYDPVVLGVNTILFLGWHALFWAAYLPISGVENLGADYPDIDPDEYDNGDSIDDVPPEEDYADEGGEGGERADTYSFYNHYGDYKHYYERADHGPVVRTDINDDSRHSSSTHFINHGALARTHAKDNSKGSLSSNYNSDGAFGPHVAYTLQDRNIYVTKK